MVGLDQRMGRKLCDKLLDHDEPYYSFEFFPPKTQMGLENLHTRIERMAKFNPLFVTVTWGTGGSTAQKSLDLAAFCERDLGLTTCLHLTCTNMDKRILDNALSRAKEAGIRNILALRGDPPRDEEYQTPQGEFKYAIDLVKYIKAQYKDWFCIGVAAYPEGHADITHPDKLDPKDDLPYLAEKIKAGASFILTQLFYDTSVFANFVNLVDSFDACLKAIPIIPAIMPIQSYQTLMRMTALSHARLPADIHDRIKASKGNDEAVKRIGVDIALELIDDIKIKTKGRIRGSHFCTLNLEKSVALILTEGKLYKPSRDTSPHKTTNGKNIVNKIIDAVKGADSVQSALPEEIVISEGQGARGREATWDEYPNGRFGDSRSPAYGELDGWGVSLGVPANVARKMWSEPETLLDISQIFVDHIEGKICGTPWSSGPLSAETEVIKEELIRLNEKQLWTVGSQPAVNCVSSSHAKFGWGPEDGFIFQKSFVEFFASESQWADIRSRISNDVNITYYAGTRRGRFETNMKPGDANAVTWGIFPGKEIAQPTIIEEISFKAWRDEAFALWTEWERLYEPASKTARLLRQVMERYWLISIVHHDFKDESALWRTI